MEAEEPGYWAAGSGSPESGAEAGGTPDWLGVSTPVITHPHLPGLIGNRRVLHPTEANPAGPRTEQQGDGEGQTEKGNWEPPATSVYRGPRVQDRTRLVALPCLEAGFQSNSSLNPKSSCPISQQAAGAVSLVPNTGPTQPTLDLHHLSLPASLLSQTAVKMHSRSHALAQDPPWLPVHLKPRLLMVPSRLLVHLVSFPLGSPHSQLAWLLQNPWQHSCLRTLAHALSSALNTLLSSLCVTSLPHSPPPFLWCHCLRELSLDH